jgi:hypothetical protein
MAKTPQLDAAKVLIERGFKLFPLKPDSSRTPAISNWQVDATSDMAQLERWTSYGWLNFGIACGASNLLVIDIDRKNGKDGLLAFHDMAKRMIFEPALTVKTPSGGYHLFYKNTDLIPCSCSKLALGIDTRGVGGYVVAPGSVLPTGVYKPISCTWYVFAKKH